METSTASAAIDNSLGFLQEHNRAAHCSPKCIYLCDLEKNRGTGWGRGWNRSVTAAMHEGGGGPLPTLIKNFSKRCCRLSKWPGLLARGRAESFGNNFGSGMCRFRMAGGSFLLLASGHG